MDTSFTKRDVFTIRHTLFVEPVNTKSRLTFQFRHCEVRLSNSTEVLHLSTGPVERLKTLVNITYPNGNGHSEWAGSLVQALGIVQGVIGRHHTEDRARDVYGSWDEEGANHAA